MRRWATGSVPRGVVPAAGGGPVADERFRGGPVPEYDSNEKGSEFLEAFTDPGPAFDPAVGPPDIWFRRVIEHTSDFVIAFQHDGTVVYVSESIEFLLGHRPADLIGTNALELIHP